MIAPEDAGERDRSVKMRVEGLLKYFPVNKGIVASLLRRNDRYVKAVDGVSFTIHEGEAFGLAGESGCGKTTTGKTAIHLLEPTAGEVYLDGEPISEYSRRELKRIRREVQIIHQDPYESLNPRIPVRRWVAEPLKVHDIGTREDRVNRVYDTLERVGLRPPDAFLDSYPSELSGGERQRVAIARAIVTDPSFLLADEPASMLDVSIRADILELFDQLEDDIGLTTLYISHDLSLLRKMCDRIGIMYLGKLVEVGPTERVIRDPKHPYTKALVASVPRIDPDETREEAKISGEVPDPVDLPSGCRFAPRCPEAMEACTRGEPPMFRVGDDHEARCILYED